jgi:DNA-binding response OmpR family regulator
MHILLVEDDMALASSLQQALKKQHYAVNTTASGTAAVDTINTDTPDIVILDLGLPDMDGLEVLSRVRKGHPTLPVLVLTARDQVDDRIAGLDGGADDYLPKPFAMAELFARLRVLERRQTTAQTAKIVVGPITLDINHDSVEVNGRALDLPRQEYRLLKSLLENVGRVQTRSALEARLYSWGEEVASNALEVHIHHLRKKLGADLITTVRGVGYKIDAPSP